MVHLHSHLGEFVMRVPKSEHLPVSTIADLRNVTNLEVCRFADLIVGTSYFFYGMCSPSFVLFELLVK